MGKSFLVILAPESFCYLLKDLILCSFGPTWYLLWVLHLSSPVFARPNLSITLLNSTSFGKASLLHLNIDIFFYT